jgi:hypothetical protein
MGMHGLEAVRALSGQWGVGNKEPDDRSVKSNSDNDAIKKADNGDPHVNNNNLRSNAVRKRQGNDIDDNVDSGQMSEVARNKNPSHVSIRTKSVPINSINNVHSQHQIHQPTTPQLKPKVNANIGIENPNKNQINTVGIDNPPMDAHTQARTHSHADKRKPSLRQQMRAASAFFASSNGEPISDVSPIADGNDNERAVAEKLHGQIEKYLTTTVLEETVRIERCTGDDDNDNSDLRDKSNENSNENSSGNSKRSKKRGSIFKRILGRCGLGIHGCCKSNRGKRVTVLEPEKLRALTAWTPPKWAEGSFFTSGPSQFEMGKRRFEMLLDGFGRFSRIDLRAAGGEGKEGESCSEDLNLIALGITFGWLAKA